MNYMSLNEVDEGWNKIIPNLHFYLIHLSDGVSLLLLETRKDGLVLNCGLLHVLPQLGNLILPLLVQLHLRVGGSSGLVQPVSELLNLPGKVGPLPLSLGTRLAFCLKFFFKLLDAALNLLHSLQNLYTSSSIIN